MTGQASWINCVVERFILCWPVTNDHWKNHELLRALLQMPEKQHALRTHKILLSPGWWVQLHLKLPCSRLHKH